MEIQDIQSQNEKKYFKNYYLHGITMLKQTLESKDIKDTRNLDALEEKVPMKKSLNIRLYPQRGVEQRTSIIHQCQRGTQEVFGVHSLHSSP